MLNARNGSSPRERGTRPSRGIGPCYPRFIPAGAGNAMTRDSSSRFWAVHPRGSGERASGAQGVGHLGGSSPRERGTRPLGVVVCIRRRFIPAGAGNAAKRPASATRSAVHPRGSGERRRRSTGWPSCTGSSPRERGTLLRRTPHILGRRFIPAGAGNAGAGTGPPSATAVHPRGSGERATGGSIISATSGSSPRERGTLCRNQQVALLRRFIPAGAGNAPTGTTAPRKTTVHPRGSGERAMRRRLTATPCGSSPRERGTRPKTRRD